jgi:gliding motility-associated-like protein
MKKHIFIVVLIINSFYLKSQIVNNGCKIFIGTNISVNAKDFVNLSSPSNGELDLDGNLILSGNLSNNSSNGNLFTNIESSPNGKFIVNGTGSIITGQNPIFFENIEVNNAVTLEIDECQIFGILKLNSSLTLNSNELIISNPDNSAIEYLSGFILSETTPTDNLGVITWNIGNSIGKYEIPFGSGNDENDLNLLLNIENEASDENGSISFATYPTNSENKPFPDGVSTLDSLKSIKIVDRYWIISPDYDLNPLTSITFKYTNEDISETNNPSLNVDSLVVANYNSNEDLWSYNIGECETNSSEKTVTINNLSSDDFLKYWTLTIPDIINPNENITVPNGFTPNNDNINDLWVIDGIEKYPDNSVIVYNRWGKKIYETKNYSNTWDGDDNPSGAYYYIIQLDNENTVSGNVNILK